MPAPEFVRLCDEMGMPLMAESFDSWAQPKVPNGYNLDFNEWHERDLTNLIPPVPQQPLGHHVEHRERSPRAAQLRRR